MILLKEDNPTKHTVFIKGGPMKFSFAHNNINVKDLDKSLAFYKEALLLEDLAAWKIQVVLSSLYI